MHADVQHHVQHHVEPAAAAHLFRALSDPTRLAILLSLRDGERRVNDIVDAVGSSQPNVSNHLRCLKGCGLVTDRPGERRQVFYAVAGAEVHELLDTASRLLTGTAVSSCSDPLMPARPKSGRG